LISRKCLIGVFHIAALGCLAARRARVFGAR
jgi:hypothetical protein